MNQFENRHPIEDIPLGTKAADVIRDMVIKGECPLGSRLLEADFAKVLGISRASIRDAFMILDNDGLLVRNPNKSTMVRLFTSKDVDDMYRLRAAVETSCLSACMERNLLDGSKLTALSGLINRHFNEREHDGGMAWIKDDMAFHEFIVTESGNDYACKVWHSLKNQILTVLYHAARHIPDVLVPVGISGAHENIVRHIGRGDAEKAMFQLQAHIMDGAAHVAGIFSQAAGQADFEGKESRDES